MAIIVIESPFAGEVKRNIEYARAALKDSLSRGESPYASHLLYTQPGVLDDLIPEQRRIGIEAGLKFHEIADKVVFYLDYGMSPGMIKAWEAAVQNGTRIEARYIYR